VMGVFGRQLRPAFDQVGWRGQARDLGNGERRDRNRNQHNGAQFTTRRGCSSEIGAKLRDILSGCGEGAAGPGVVPATSSNVSASLFAVIPEAVTFIGVT
jgi:hypothetical protein